MKIRFDKTSELYRVRQGIELPIHDTFEDNGKTYYCFDAEDGLPPICVTHGTIKGIATIEGGEVKSIYDRLQDEIKEKENVDESRESESSNSTDEQA